MVFRQHDKDYNDGDWRFYPYALAENPKYGKFTVGHTYNAAFQLHQGAQEITWIGIQDSNLPYWLTSANWVNGLKTVKFATPKSTNIMDDGRSFKFSYFTPMIGNTKFGFSYAPDNASRRGMVSRYTSYQKKEDGYTAAMQNKWNPGLDIFEIKKGTMVYDKEISGGASSVIVGEGATLDIGTNALHSGGEKGVDSEGVHFKDNSTLAFTVTDKDTYGKIHANYVNISENGTNLNMTLNGAALAKGETTTLKLFNGEDSDTVEIEGKFANLSQNSRYEFTDNGDGTFNVTSVGSATDAVVDAGGSANNAGTAEAWDSVSASTSSPVAAAVTEKLAQLSNSTNAAEQKAYVDALTAVAPEVAPMVQKTQTETANQVFGAVSTRLTGGSISTGGEGMASGDNIFKRGAMWVQGLFNKSKLDDTSKAKGFDADSNGIAFGAEKFVTDDTKVGIGYAYTNTDIDGFMRDTDVDTHTAILYGEYKPSNWYVNGIATYGWSDYEESKSVAGVGVKADYDVETFGLQAMTGYDMNINGLGITPEAGLRYVHIKQDAYKDSADQRVSANDSDILTGVIGAKVSKNFELSNGMNIKPEARIAATYDLFNDDVNSVVTLANGSAYAVEGEALDRFGMEFSAGVTAEVNDNVELSLGYEGKFRQDYQDHTGLINAKYKF